MNLNPSVDGSLLFRLVRISAVALAAIAVLVTLGAAQARAAERGELDPSFGTAGQETLPAITTAFPMAQIEAVATEPDGKIVLVGLTSVYPRDESDFLVVRLDADGSLDPSFSGDGVQTTDFDGFGDGAAAVAIAPDGKIVVAGFASDAAGSGHSTSAVVRYDADGSLDPTFGVGGRQIVDYGAAGGGSEGAQAVALQPDGKVVLAGSADTSGGTIAFGVARLDAEGGLDPSFGTGGLQTTAFNGVNDAARSIALQPDGKILALGSTRTASGTELALARYDADGELDPGFSGDGKVTSSFSPIGRDEPRGLALRSDGKILVAGNSAEEPVEFVETATGVLARYQADGSLDTGFGDDGLVTVAYEPLGEVGDFIPPSSVPRGGISLAVDGTAFLAGEVTYYDEVFATHQEAAVAAFDPDGAPDQGFSADGLLTLPSTGSTGVQTSALDSQGRLVLVGTLVDQSGPQIQVSRLFGLTPSTEELGDGEEPAGPEEPGSPGAGGGPAAAIGQAPAPVAAPNVACRRASAGLRAARKRLGVAGKRVQAARRKLARADGAKRQRAARRSLRRSRTRFESSKKNRDRATAKAAARC